MKTIFALTLGTITLLLAVNAHDSLSARVFLAAVGLALYSVALGPVSGRGEEKTSWPRKPSDPKVNEPSGRTQVSWAERDSLNQSILTFSPIASRSESPLNYHSSMPPTMQPSAVIADGETL